ncbi:hypothetical protein SERLA73DRAFT_166989 [Serpula lacrymans var. lacrymans S7.3]|uniref:Uncharacterized protein n=2 Tax=Serpula lacrymans var. lacrymans TaxID=341189 RepID=F8PSB5_SERL3|nr:uncharacterized protein SERLADRAFT_463156 [Serpula lacrymans var. lacrymans S7.9]EGO00728.1 hypothetical protein SERLA73DRAFT_166989 [Serpula lacrymans var. lacrymans S7.3]EGO26273.1 hypothetical protein SERLADRAFT_463156 [Serpula lacrymans var. lacrymans S7.9]
MPFGQSGNGATSNVGTYNDVAGNQTNTHNDNSRNENCGNTNVNNNLAPSGDFSAQIAGHGVQAFGSADGSVKEREKAYLRSH